MTGERILMLPQVPPEMLADWCGCQVILEAIGMSRWAAFSDDELRELRSLLYAAPLSFVRSPEIYAEVFAELKRRRQA